MEKFMAKNMINCLERFLRYVYKNGSLFEEVKFDDIKKSVDTKLFKSTMANMNHVLRHCTPPVCLISHELRLDTFPEACVYSNFNYRQFFSRILR